MAKQIIVLGQSSSGIETSYQVAFWFPASSGVATQTNGSAWTGASAAENSAIQAGTVIEEVQAFSFPTGIAGSVIEAFLQQFWTNRNAQINGVGPHQFYGSAYDPSAGGWTVA